MSPHSQLCLNQANIEFQTSLNTHQTKDFLTICKNNIGCSYVISIDFQKEISKTKSRTKTSSRFSLSWTEIIFIVIICNSPPPANYLPFMQMEYSFLYVLNRYWFDSVYPTKVDKITHYAFFGLCIPTTIHDQKIVYWHFVVCRLFNQKTQSSMEKVLLNFND